MVGLGWVEVTYLPAFCQAAWCLIESLGSNSIEQLHFEIIKLSVCSPARSVDFALWFLGQGGVCVCANASRDRRFAGKSLRHRTDTDTLCRSSTADPMDALSESCSNQTPWRL